MKIAKNFIKKQKNNAPELSCIIITFNEEEHLPRLLNSLKEQTFKNFEIIVADYNSRDKTREIARNFGCKIIAGGMPSRGRNNGAKIAKGEYLLFLDADSVLPEDFLELNFRAFQESGRGIGAAPLKPLSNRKIDRFLFKFFRGWSFITSRISPHCAGTSMFTKKEVFQKVGGFDENVVFAEDHAFARKAKNYGLIILPQYAYTSTRRLEKEGRLRFVGKYVYAGLYRLFNHEITKEIFEYEFSYNKPVY